MNEFLEQNSIYITIIISLIIWLGIAFYISRIDSGLKKVEKHLFADNDDVNL